MPGNVIGRLFRLVSFGESHGPAIGGVVEGFPAGIIIDPDFIQNEMDKRKPGVSDFSSPRKEIDQIEILSGVFDGRSLGTPIAFIVKNQDAKPEDYLELAKTFRPSHADYTYTMKYGIRDYRGGGRSSARETLTRVAAGALAKIYLASNNIFIQAYTSSIGTIAVQKEYYQLKPEQAELNDLRCPDPDVSVEMMKLLDKLREEGDTTGGTVTCLIYGAPAGLGEPVYDKTEALLANAMLSINACMGFEFGTGFRSAAMKGSENNDQWKLPNDKAQNFTLSTKSNNSGGIQGGITNGQPIWFRVAFKPVASIHREQVSYTENGEEIIIPGKGRHDVCVVPRAVAVVEAMAALVIADLFLQQKAFNK